MVRFLYENGISIKYAEKLQRLGKTCKSLPWAPIPVDSGSDAKKRKKKNSKNSDLKHKA